MRLEHALGSQRVRLTGDASAARRAAPQLRLHLLGGFRAERADGEWPVSVWQRRSAKALTKLLAISPGHRLHREQVLDLLWPGVELESALNSFGKALHAARRALEPELLPREGSSYLLLTDSMVALDATHVWIDADQFELTAERALRQGDVGAYETAVAAYTGELLPEDRYEEWCAERREYLGELHTRLLLGLADALTARGAHGAAAARLREVLLRDPTREEVHRRLMAVYASAGTRDLAVRQFHVCEDVLRRELEMVPGDATRALYDKIVAAPAAEAQPAQAATFVGREPLLRCLREQLERADGGNGSFVLLSGEAGVGKSRLVAEFAREARERSRCCVLSGGSGTQASHLAYGPFALALENHVACRSDAERDELTRRYPALAPFVPSLGDARAPFADRAADDQLYLVPTIVRLLTDLARDQSLVLVLGDLHGLHRSTLDLLGYLAPLAAERRWLIIGTYREESLPPGSGLRRIIDATTRERLSVTLEVERLPRADCDRLVRALLPGRRVDQALLDQAYTRSLGNPLFVEELLREQAPGGVPARVRALVRLRTAPMRDCERRLLALIAAAGGRRVSLDDLRGAGAALTPPISDAALFDGLDRALDLRILDERDGYYAFRHPLVRAALFEDLSKHRRDELQDALSRARPQRA